MVRRPLVKHSVWHNKEEKEVFFDFYDEIPQDKDLGEWDFEPYYSDISKISGKLLIEALSNLIEEYNLDDAHVAWVTNHYGGYFEDVYVCGWVPKTEEDIDAEIAAGIEGDRKKEQEKEAKKEAREAKKKEKELAVLKELSEKYGVDTK
jgi:hypothetical protein